MSHLNITLAPYKYHLEHCGLVMCQITRTGHLPTAANSEHFVNCNITAKWAIVGVVVVPPQKKYGVSIIVSFIVVENSHHEILNQFCLRHRDFTVQQMLYGAAYIYIYIKLCNRSQHVSVYHSVSQTSYGIISKLHTLMINDQVCAKYR